MEKHQVLTVLVADDEPELLGAVCQLIDWESLGFRLVGRRERIARDCHGRWLDTFLMERRCKDDEPSGYRKL